jgi:hypothetical protein
MENTSLEVATDEMAADELMELADSASTCNGAAWSYVEEHEDAVVCDGFIEGSPTQHCWIHDRERGIVIDPTLGQFDDHAFAGVWDGDEHPHANDEEVYTWSDREAFVEAYDEGGSGPFIL